MKIFSRIWLAFSFLFIGSGICLLVIVAGSRSKYQNSSAASMDESYKEVHSLDIDINSAYVQIKEGRDFHIRAKNLPDKLESRVENGIWIIKDKNEKPFVSFGPELLTHFLWRDHFELFPEIMITIPDDFTAMSFSLNVDAGVVDADMIQAKACDLAVNTGKLTISNIKVNGPSTYQVSTGLMELKDMVARDVTATCKLGLLELDGSITGENQITCSTGSVSMKLDGDYNDYKYMISSGTGTVSLNGEDYHNKNITLENPEAANSISLHCKTGSISADIDNR